MAANNTVKATQAGLKLLSYLEALLAPKTFIKLVGGTHNVYVRANIQGFRKGDESEDALIASTLGEIGSQKVSGPLRHIQTNLKMTESEFFIYWLLNRI